MALPDLSSFASYSTFYGSVPPGTQAQYEAIIAALSKAIRKKLSANITQTTYSVVLNAPLTTQLILPGGDPVCAFSLSLFRSPQARGNPNAFTESSRLTEYVDYALDVDASCPERSTTRIVTSLQGPWGACGGSIGGYRVGMLAADFRPAFGVLKAEFTAGYDEVPDDITMAVNLGVSKIWARTMYGTPFTSESRGGYNYSLSGEALKVLNDPDVWDLLAHYQSATSVIG